MKRIEKKMEITISEFEEIVARMLEGRAKIICPCGVKTTLKTDWRELKRHIKHLLYFSPKSDIKNFPQKNH